MKNNIIDQSQASLDLLCTIQTAFIWSSHSWNGKLPCKPNLLPFKKFIESLDGKLLLQAILPDDRIKTYSFDNPQALQRNPDFQEGNTSDDVLMSIYAHLSDPQHTVDETPTFFEKQSRTLELLKQFGEPFGGKMALLIEKPSGVMTRYRL